MDKPWDNGSKRLLEEATQDFLDWLLKGAFFTGQRSQEFESRQLDADIMHEMLFQGERVLCNVEFQSGPDSEMELRLLEYCVLAYRRYLCPVYTVVVYLKKGGKVAVPPFVMRLPDGEEVLRHNFRVINLYEIPYEEMLAKGLPGLLPLVPLALNGARREVVEEIIRRLARPGEPVRKELLALTRLFASLAFKSQEDQEWLRRRFGMLKDILRETPAFQQILEEGLEEGLEKGREEGLEKGRKEGSELEQQRHLQSLRQKLLNLIHVRYSELFSLAQEQVSLIKEPEVLEDLFFKIAIAGSVKDVRSALLMQE
jgi:predicted transposase YdaD